MKPARLAAIVTGALGCAMLLVSYFRPELDWKWSLFMFAYAAVAVWFGRK